VATNVCTLMTDQGCGLGSPRRTLGRMDPPQPSLAAMHEWSQAVEAFRAAAASGTVPAAELQQLQDAAESARARHDALARAADSGGER
jgi:hypothetical protein